MHNLTYVDFVRELNKGMVIKGSKIVSYGTEPEIVARKTLLDSYLIAIKVDGVKALGINIVSVVDNELLKPNIRLKFLSVGNTITSHTDASLVSDKVLDAYKEIRRNLFNWNRDTNSGYTFSDVLANYEYEVSHG
jgi:hypothetical protein